MPKKNASETWQTVFEIPVPDTFSIEQEISWPESLKPKPFLTAYENPDTGELRVEIFCTKQPKGKTLKTIHDALSGFLGVSVATLKFRKLEPEDWVSLSLEDLEPIEAGRFFVHGSHLKDQVPDGKISLLIDTGFAFGTGHHETTKGCLVALDRLADKIMPKAVLDLGCGTGILAFAAKKLWPTAEVRAGDSDMEAVRTAQENARKNKVPDVEVFYADGFDHPGLRDAQFDFVIANILAGPLIDLAPEMAGRIPEGGLLILSGLLKVHEENVLRSFEKEGFRHMDTVADKGWPTVILEKLS